MPHHPRPPRLILASGSPRRKELLGRLDIPFVVDPGDVVERPPHPGEDPAAYALELARQKADEGARRHPCAIVLGADTVVTVDGAILGKPRDERHALDMLRRLCGRRHHVITAVAVCSDDTNRSDIRQSDVCMASVPDDDLRAYIATGEPIDKAGSYAVQGRGGRLVESIAGCYNNIVGLPLCLASKLLVESGVRTKSTPESDPHFLTQSSAFRRF